MTTYKLTYFPARARAELIRLIFAQAGVEYENVRLPYYPYGSEEWAAKKESELFLGAAWLPYYFLVHVSFVAPSLTCEI